jgi:hypothetical protein
MFLYNDHNFLHARNVPPSDYSEAPKSSLHALLQEHRDGLDGITFHPECENGDIRACTQELIGGGEVQILLIKLGPLRCLIPTGMEHGGEYSHRRSTEAFGDTICAPYLILDVDMELM